MNWTARGTQWTLLEHVLLYFLGSTEAMTVALSQSHRGTEARRASVRITAFRFQI